MIIVRLLSPEPAGCLAPPTLLGSRSRHCHGINITSDSLRRGQGTKSAMHKAHQNRLSGDDGGLRPARPPFSFVRYWGKIFLGVTLLTSSALLLMTFTSRMKAEHGGIADFVR